MNLWQFTLVYLSQAGRRRIFEFLDGLLRDSINPLSLISLICFNVLQYSLIENQYSSCSVAPFYALLAATNYLKN